MHTCYVDEATRSIADLAQPGELMPCWTITRINVPARHRRQGHGTVLLQRILRDADSEGLTLALEPVPSGGPDYAGLVTWYVKHGFRMLSSGYMVRKPSKVMTVDCDRCGKTIEEEDIQIAWADCVVCPRCKADEEAGKEFK